MNRRKKRIKRNLRHILPKNKMFRFLKCHASGRNHSLLDFITLYECCLILPIKCATLTKGRRKTEERNE